MSAPSSPGRTAAMLVGVAVTMASLSFAAVPFYDWFCRVTGYAGTTGTATAATGEVLDRTIRIRFTANVGAGMPWKFRPMQNEVEVRIGETVLAYYEAVNTAARPVAGTASFNVAPDQAGYYFDKIDCFCFTEQVLQPGERVEMPVTFFVDPAIVDGAETAGIHTITLSYTFFETPLPEEQAALAPVPGSDVN